MDRRWMLSGSVVGSYRRGLALAMVAIMIALIAGFAAALMVMATTNSENVLTHMQREEALAEANSGIMSSIAEITTMRDAGGDGWGWMTTAYANGSYRVVGESIAGGEFRAIARGTTNEGTVRYVEAVFRPSPPIPASEAALGFYGRTIDPKDKIRLEIHGDGPNEEDTVKISGIDPNGHPSMPAVGVEDPDGYKTLMERLSQKIADGKKVSEASFEGTPVVAYTNDKGDTVNVPIIEVPNPRLSSDNLEAFRSTVFDTLKNDVIPAADYVINDHINKGEQLVLGTLASPVVVVVDGKDIHIDGGASITGAGILIVTKDWHLHHATINWTGTIIVMGDNKHGDSKIKNHHAALNITGNLLAIGGDGGSARIDIHNDDKKRDSSTHITGTVMALGGPDDKSKAEFRHHHGDMTVDGFVAALGQRAKIKIDENGGGKDAIRQFTLNGAMVVAVPNTEDKGAEKLEVKLHGNVTLQYDKEKQDAALQNLVGFMGLLNLPPQAYSTVSWREMPQALGDAAMAAMTAPPIPAPGSPTIGGGAGELVPALGGGTSPSPGTAPAPAPTPDPGPGKGKGKGK